MIEQWGRPNPAQVWLDRQYGERKGSRVIGLSDAIRHLLGRFGRPEVHIDATERDDVLDGRLTSLEREQVEIAARLRVLEKAANPRGIGRDY